MGLITPLVYTNDLSFIVQFTSVYTQMERVEDELPAIRANICIFTSICTINYLYHDQKTITFLIYSSDIQVNYKLHL